MSFLGPVETDPLDEHTGPSEGVCRDNTNPNGAYFIASWKNLFGDCEFEIHHGLEKDAQHLKALFAKNGYKCVGELNDPTKQQTFDKLTFGEYQDFLQNVNFFVGIFLGYGNSAGLNLHNGEEIRVNELLELFSNCNCPSLKGKPKIFLIQYKIKHLTTTDINNSAYKRFFDHDSLSEIYLFSSAVGGDASCKHTDNESEFTKTFCRIFRERPNIGIYEMLPLLNQSTLLHTDMAVCDFQAIGNKEDFFFSSLASNILDSSRYGLSFDQKCTKESVNAPDECKKREELVPSISLQPSLRQGSEVVRSTDNVLLKNIYCLNEKPRGTVCIINSITGCKRDINNLEAMFYNKGYRVKTVPEASSCQQQMDNIKQSFSNFSGPLVVFFFGYGYDDVLLFGKEKQESVSYKAFCFKLRKFLKEDAPLILFTNLCLEKRPLDAVDHSEEKASVMHTFHTCVKVEGKCENGSLFIKTMLNELSNGGFKKEIYELCKNAISKTNEMQAKDCDGYYVDFRCYGISKKFYFLSPNKVSDSCVKSSSEPKTENSFVGDYPERAEVMDTIESPSQSKDKGRGRKDKDKRRQPNSSEQKMPLTTPQNTELQKCQQATCHSSAAQNGNDIQESESAKEGLPEHHTIALNANTHEDFDVTKTQRSFLRKLGLEKEFPEKISLHMVMKQSFRELNTYSDIPWNFLSQMLMINYKGRDNIMSKRMEADLCSGSSQVQGKDQEVDDILLQLGSITQNECSKVHPLDVIVAVFRCCSDLLRQVICEKMFTCKLSIPLLLTPFLGHKSLLLLWSLRDLHIPCISSEGDHSLVSAVTHPFPVVSFVRLGEIFRSKSKFLNDMLNSQSHHSTFFHRDCKNGWSTRVISDGLIEMAWRLNTLKEEDNECFDSNIVILNLRGNGKFRTMQVNFLTRISDVMVIMLNVKEFDYENVIDIMEQAKHLCGHVIFMITKHPSVPYASEDREKVKSCIERLRHTGVPMPKFLLDIDNGREKNPEQLKEELDQIIHKCLMTGDIKGTLSNCKEIVQSFVDIKVEGSPECMSSRNMASQVIEKTKGSPHERVKSMLLPLQCKPWKTWAILNKEEHRGDRRGNLSFKNYVDKIYRDKKKQREEQICLLEKPTAVFDCFVENLMKSNQKEILYYLKWLSIYLNDRSRDILPELQKKCRNKWSEISSNDREGRKHIDKLKSELLQCEKAIEESSLGLEHFMREVAQAFESALSVKGIPKKLLERVSKFPKLFAGLMLQGYPLEIMDGDAGHIPMQWVKAVLMELHKMIGDKKICIFSVLGIQSSGKSTLLNAMFGLQFNVSAGRCTRGVYAQLVPVPQNYQSCKYDFILVLDTEGLKAPELGERKNQHDNEIATFVIGLGDVTLVNIKGENVSEIEDVLQIVIHALLKMKLVNKNIALQPSCFFVHQNVSAIDAKQQLESGQRKFIETLDKVTKVAGKQEDAPHFTKFNELIEFDINENVSYFSDLWKGDPPLAPANPGYSNNVKEVKERLLSNVLHKRKKYLDIPQLLVKITDLWNGILEQNFVFSFKNNLELEAYSSLESKVSDLQWNLKKDALKWFNAKSNVIGNLDEIRENLETDMVSELCCYLKNRFDEEWKDLERYFEMDEDNAVLQQWRARSFQTLENCYSDLMYRQRESIKRELQKKKIQSDSKKDIEKCKIKIMDEVKILAEELRSDECKSLNENDVKQYFKERWNKWMDAMDIGPEDDIVIGDRIKKILFDQFPQDNALLKNILENYHINSEDAIRNETAHVIDKYIRNSWKQNIRHLTLNYQNIKTKELIENMFRIIKDMAMGQNGQPFTREDIESMIGCCMNTVDAIKATGASFKNENEFCLYLILCTYDYAAYVQHEKNDILRFDIQTEEAQEMNSDQCFDEILEQKQMFPADVLAKVKEFRTKTQTSFISVTKGDLVEVQEIDKNDLVPRARILLQKYLKELELSIKRPEIQNFKEEYFEEAVMKAKNISNGNIQFTKAFIMKLAIYTCYKALPVFHEKQKMYTDSLNPRKVLERDYYDTYFEMVRNAYHKIAAEEALSKVVSKRLRKAIKDSVSQAMTAELADDIRNNVPQLRMKKALLQAILYKLVEMDQFEEFFLYLSDINACYEKWISYFIDNYLFCKQPNGSNRYTEIASMKISSLISSVREDIVKADANTIQKSLSDDALEVWVEKFHERVTEKLPIPLSDILSLTNGYEILTLKSFTDYLERNLRKLEGELLTEFKEHAKHHMKKVLKPVYQIIAQECKGCTKRCPFCSAPCTMNNENHLENNIKHLAYEHYSQGCGGWEYIINQKLCIENCTASVASDGEFKCRETDLKLHPFKKYHTIFPDWQIHGDKSLEASSYWKWFLVKYESELAKKYHAKRPEIPGSWRSITKEMAMESLGN